MRGTNARRRDREWGPTRPTAFVDAAAAGDGPSSPTSLTSTSAEPSPYAGLGYLRRSGLITVERFRREGPGLRPNSIYSLWGVLLFTPALYFWTMIAMFGVFFVAASSRGAMPEATIVMVLPAVMLLIRWFTRPLSRRERERLTAARRGR